jgi:hypothetical protein
MRKTVLILACALTCLGATAPAEDMSGVSDRDLARGSEKLAREIRDMDALLRKLESSGRSSSNAGRRSAIEGILDAMVQIVYDREEVLGEEHTIKRHGDEVQTGLTDAAEVGTPMATKKTRRRIRKGEAEELPDALRRLTRMQTIVVSARRIEVPAVDRQGETFEQLQGMCREFGEILRTEQAVIVNEQLRRQEAAAGTTDTP